jgi:two-component system sensor histidine kinase YesM
MFQFIYTTSPYTKWKVIGVFSLNETLKEVSNIRYYTMLILIIISIVATGISIIFSASIAEPIRKLRILMKKAESGDLEVEFKVKSNDEIGQLGESFNRMIEEIKNLINEVYKEQKSKREAELRTLQSQIKPHFLYNTLGTIYWMAKDCGAKNVMQMISALTNLFRIGLSKGNEIISLSEEIEHISNYLIILKMRYAEILDYDISSDEELNGLLVQKLILQPIVENAVYHGIKEKGSPGRVQILVYLEDDILHLIIKDDGVGISEDTLKTLNTSLNAIGNRKEGYGLFNVNERIRLSYGREFGVTVKSELGKGTTVEIRHPVIKNM